MTSRMPASPCPSCGKMLDAASAPGGPDAVAKAGDVTVCLYCGHLMAFADDGLGLRELTSDEMHEVAGHPGILRIQRARGKLKGNSS